MAKNNQYRCPKCGGDRMVKNGRANTTAKQKYKCKGCGHTTVAPHPPDFVPMRDKLPKKQRYIITAAQNATPVHKGFWRALLNAAKFYDAELVVIPGRYKNPTSTWSQASQEHEWWADEVLPYLLRGRVFLNDRLVILGDVKVQWAARSPLTSLDTLTGERSGIVGHGNRALRSIPSPHHRYPKLMFTTGACTVENYTDTKRGKIAEFNHSIGALIVELDASCGDDVFYARQLNATKNGSFIDLDMEFTSDGMRMAKPSLSLTMGDTHHRWLSKDVAEATFGKQGMIALLDPQYTIWHDLLDFHARNHHHQGDWLTGFGKWKHGIESVRAEVEQAVEFVNERTPVGRKSIIVSGNHDRALQRWLGEVDFRQDPANVEFYLEVALDTIKSVRVAEGGIEYADPFITYGRKMAQEGVQFLESGESCVIGGVEHGLHGDLGPNGGRGTTRNLSQIGIKVTKGHSHIAEIIDGCYSAGKSTGHLEYEGGGPSSHSQAHVVLYANGKRSMVFIVKGRFCLPRPSLSKK